MADENSVIIDMLRESARAGEARSDARHAEVMTEIRGLKTTFEAHEEKDDKRFEDINMWRYKLIGGGIVLMTVMSFAAPVAAGMLGVGG